MGTTTMLRKLATLLLPFVLVTPLGFFLTPLVVRADSITTHWTPRRACIDKSENYVALVRIQYKERVSGSNKSRLFTGYEFRRGNFGHVRKSQAWARREINEKSTQFPVDQKEDTDNPSPNKTIPSHVPEKNYIAVKTGVKRFAHVWLYTDDAGRTSQKKNNTCDVEIPF